MARCEACWSVTAYDRQAHTVTRDVDRASCSSQIPDFETNSDGSSFAVFGRFVGDWTWRRRLAMKG